MAVESGENNGKAVGMTEHAEGFGFKSTYIFPVVAEDFPDFFEGVGIAIVKAEAEPKEAVEAFGKGEHSGLEVFPCFVTKNCFVEGRWVGVDRDVLEGDIILIGNDSHWSFGLVGLFSLTDAILG